MSRSGDGVGRDINSEQQSPTAIPAREAREARAHPLLAAPSSHRPQFHGSLPAGGGVLGFPTFTGHYWHTTDYGETWELNELPGAYAFDLSFPPGQNATGYSTVLTPALSRLARYA